MLARIIGVAALAALGAGLLATAGPALAEEPDMTDPRVQKYMVGDKYSGYIVNEKETRDMQEDDFENPAFLWVDQAAELWSKPDGKAGKSCQDCHGSVEESMKGVGATYPKYYAPWDKLATVEHIINICRKDRMQADEWKWESDQMLGMSALVRLQSRGMPVNVSVDGKNAPFFEKGKEFYFQRRGQMDLACTHCHVDNPGNKVRSEKLSMGMPNGFPTYRMKWAKLGSLHRRFTGCNKNIRAQPYKRGSEEYTNLELYTMWRANGLPVEAPSVRK